MDIRLRYTFFVIIFFGFLHISGTPAYLQENINPGPEKDSVKTSGTDGLDTVVVLRYPFRDETDFEPLNDKDTTSLYLNPPSNIKTMVEYDPLTGEYTIYEKIGDFYYRLPQTMSFEDYTKADMERSIRNYWRKRASQEDFVPEGASPAASGLMIEGKTFGRIFGGNSINLSAKGFAQISIGYQVRKTDNPSISENLRKTVSLDFTPQVQVYLTGTVGEKLKISANYNSGATLDYENMMKLDYSGDHDEIIKKIEAGNVSMSTNNSLITGTSNLFGVKTEMQFGKLDVTTIFSQSKGTTVVLNTQNGSTKTSFEISAADYDANRHFFLSQYFRDHYDQALRDLPNVKSSVTINKIEVWITNKSGNYTDSRNILALMDLAEHSSNIYNSVPAFKDPGGWSSSEKVYPFNTANNMYNELISNYPDIRTVSKVTSVMKNFSSYGFEGGQDFEKVEQARLLSSSEYTFNANLGYISLKTALSSDEVLAVAYSYTTADGQTFQIGEFSTDGITSPKTLIVKLLKGSTLTPKLPTWKLMMKNIYSLGASGIQKDNFQLNILFNSRGRDITYLPGSNLAGHNLLKVMNLDNLDAENEVGSDGAFDYIDSLTIISSTGRIIFPSVEPFGSHLADSLSSGSYIDEYTYQSLYDSTRTYAEQDAEHNKFTLQGSYTGTAGSEISLGTTNLAQGAVTVTCGGVTLTEYVDYVVDYNLGKVKIINESLLDSGNSIQITLNDEDSSSSYSTQKTLVGAHANYAFSDKFNLGTTLLHMQERTSTSKVDYGDDPVSNTMFGLDASYNSESQLLTKILNKLPFVNTDETSAISLTGEYARLFPGHSSELKDDGTVYIDDFESSRSSISLKSVQDWSLASTPQKQDIFPEGDLDNDLAYGYNRARLAWYTIDPIFLRNSSSKPGYITTDDQSNHLVREVYEKEIYPDKDTETSENSYISVFNLAYYPDEKGPYNYDVLPSSYSAGINSDGTLKSPETRWGGIMRKLSTTNFESANISYIEFWVMDPFVNDTLQTNEGGDLYIDLGDISEDILKDSRKSFENGLPETADLADVDTTHWGVVTKNQELTTSFVSNDEIIVNQDVGFDGLNDAREKDFYNSYLQQAESVVDNNAYTEISSDPSSDDYHYFRGSDYDEEKFGILERYKQYNGVEGNSVPASKSPESYETAATSKPDMEDINADYTLGEYEHYFQYHVSVRRGDMSQGSNFITDVQPVSVKLRNGSVGTVNWYKFSIPVNDYEEAFGSISDFKSIRFMRMFMRGFKKPVVMRFATLDLVRGEWRTYDNQLDNTTASAADTQFDVSTVNIEDDGSREPVNYVLPPGVSREVDTSSSSLLEENEQSLDMKVLNLAEEDARAVYKSVDMDFTSYKYIRMYVHAEAVDGYPLNNDDLCFFIRLGSDYKSNYYEYEVPLKLTRAGTYNNNLTADRDSVWPEANYINVPLSLFTDAKLDRNAIMNADTSDLSLSDVYETIHEDWNDDKNYVKVKGNPNLTNVEVMMMGIRYKDNGDGISDLKSVDVWADELRLTGFDESGGWAGKVSGSIKLADIGTVSFSGTKRTSGFGNIDDGVSERSTEDYSEYSFASNLDVGKLLPKEAKVKIPMYINASKSVTTPKYNPLDPDITVAETLSTLQTKAEQDSVKNLFQEVTENKSFALTNVRVDKTIRRDSKTTPVDPANFSFSYSHNESKYHDVDTKYDNERNTRVILNYTFNNQPRIYEPFKNVKWMKGSLMKLIRDFNFSLAPTLVSYKNEFYRHYEEVQLRDITDPDMVISPTYDKDFLWYRYFSLQYNLTRSLKFNFSSQGTARIDEPDGSINKSDSDYEAKRDTIIKNILKLGRPVEYTHTLNVTYLAPVNKIPYMEWLNLTGAYQAFYEWDSGTVTDSTDLGNEIQNTRIEQITAQGNMSRLYDKIPFLKKVNQEFKRSSGRGRRSSHHSLKEETFPYKLAVYSARTLMSVKTVSFAYSATDGSTLPGFMPVPKWFGIGNYTPDANTYGSTASSKAPGVPFILGWQDKDFAMKAGRKGWLTKDTTLNSPFIMTHKESYNMRSSIEPIPNLKIELTATRTFAKSRKEYYTYDPASDAFNPSSPTESGSFSMSINTFRTAFSRIGKADIPNSKAFTDMLGNRIIVARRLARQRGAAYLAYDDASLSGGVNGYPYGFGETSQEVVIPAFFAAYTGQSAEKVPLDPFPSLKYLRPNWKISYNGLVSKIEGLNKVMKTMSITHSFYSLYNVGSFTSNSDYEASEDGFCYVINDDDYNFVSRYDISAINITEQFSPLINIDIIWLNDLSTSLSIKRTRQLTLSFSSSLLTEILSNEYDVGVGYHFKNFNIFYKSKRKQKAFSNDLKVSTNLAFEKNKTLLRYFSTDEDQLSAGEGEISLKTTADYSLSNNFSLQLYYNQALDRPYTSSSYPTSTTNVGVSFRFTMNEKSN